MALGLLSLLQGSSDENGNDRRSISEDQKNEKEAKERSRGDERPGVTPEEAIQGSSSGTTIGRASNPWGTHGKSRRGDRYDD